MIALFVDGRLEDERAGPEVKGLRKCKIFRVGPNEEAAFEVVFGFGSPGLSRDRVRKNAAALDPDRDAIREDERARFRILFAVA